MSARPNRFRCLNVELAEEGATEWGERRRVVFVLRMGILRIELHRGIVFR